MAMTQAHFDMVVIGSLCVDLVFSGLPHWPAPGQEIYVSDFALGAGEMFTIAATLSRLGLRVGLLGEVGNDFFSRYVLDEIERAGISSELVFVRDYPLRAVSVCLPYEGERGLISYTEARRSSSAVGQRISRAAAERGFAADMLTRLEQVSWSAAFLYLYPRMRDVLRLLKQRGAPIFLDAGCSLSTITASRFAELAAFGDYFMPNQAEAAMITGQESPAEAARLLARSGPVPIIKIGAEGAIAWRNGELVRCPAWPVAEVVDTTGAGDAFDAGFIYGILRNYSFLEALRCGTICGSLSTTALTGTAAVPTAEELEQLRSRDI